MKRSARGVRLAAASILLLALDAAVARAAGVDAGEPANPDARFFEEFTFASGRAAPSVVKVGRDDDVWFAMARAGRIGRWRDGVIDEFPLPPQSFPVGLAIDADDRVWYSDIRRNKICRLDPENGAVAEFAIPTANSWPFYIVLGLDGRLYFTERMGNNIGRLDPRTGEVVEFPVPTPDASPAGMAVTPDGAIYFTENSGNRVGRLDPERGTIEEIPVPTPSVRSPFYGLAGIASDRDGNLWFAVVDGRLGFLARGARSIEEIPVANPTGRPAGVAVDRDGVVWFTELDGNAITSYDPHLGVFRSYRIPTGEPDRRPKGPPEATARGELPVPGFTARTSRPFGIAADSRGRIWFSEQYGHKLGVLSPPEAEIFAPTGVVSGATALITVQLRGEARSARLRYLLDGVEVPVAHRLDLSRVGPGAHRFAVEVDHGGGRRSRSAVVFDFRPDLETVAAAVRGAGIPDQLDQVTRDDLAGRVEQAKALRASGDGVAARAAVSSLREAVERRAADGGAGALLDRVFQEQLRYLDLFGDWELPVRLLGEAPWFEPDRVAMAAGDTLSFAVPRDGSPPPEPPTPFVAVRRSANGVVSHGFLREGRYPYHRPGDPAAALAVDVGPRTGYLREIPVPAGRVPGVMVVDRHDNVWFTAGGGGFLHLGATPLNNRIGRIAPDGTLHEYETPTPESGPTSVAVAPDGRVWFTERGANQLGSLDPESGEIREFPLPTPNCTPIGVAVAPDGRVWYTAKHASRIGVFDPVTAKFTEIDTPTPDSEPSTITVDDDGFVWFDERANDRIVRLDPRDGGVREYRVPTPGSRVVGLVPDGRGHVWFLELGGNKVGRLEIESGAVVEFGLPTPRAAPFKLAIDRAGRVWFTEVFGNRIGMLDGDRIFEFALPTAEAMPGGIAINSRGDVFFSQQAADSIGVLPRAAAPWSGASSATGLRVGAREYTTGDREWDRAGR